MFCPLQQSIILCKTDLGFLNFYVSIFSRKFFHYWVYLSIQVVSPIFLQFYIIRNFLVYLYLVVSKGFLRQNISFISFDQQFCSCCRLNLVFLNDIHTVRGFMVCSYFFVLYFHALFAFLYFLFHVFLLPRIKHLFVHYALFRSVYLFCDHFLLLMILKSLV